MAPRHNNHDRRTLLDAKLTELMLYAKELCPEAVVEASTIQYDDEDGHIRVFSPSTLSETEEERIEMALGARAGEIFDATVLFILCAVFDTPARS